MRSPAAGGAGAPVKGAKLREIRFSDPSNTGQGKISGLGGDIMLKVCLFFILKRE